jgi:hypothetical protein
MSDSLLNALNNAGVLKSTSFTRLSDLALDKLYRVMKAEYMNTKYGEKVCITLDSGHRVILPDRFTSRLKADNNKLFDYVNSGVIGMIYKGMVKSAVVDKYMHDILFVEMR